MRYLFGDLNGDTELTREEAVENAEETWVSWQEEKARKSGFSIEIFDGFVIVVIAENSELVTE